MVLLFTNKEDAHPNLVLDILAERGVPFFRLNTEDLLTDYSFSWWSRDGVCDFEITNIRSGLYLRGSEITAVWDRRPEPPKGLPVHNTEEINAHNLREALVFLQFLRHFVEDIPSIGSIVGDRVADSKMLQYRTALDCGFIVPETVFSNRKEALEELSSRHAELCLKPINGFSLWDEENGFDYVFYTQVLASADLPGIPEEAFSQTVSFVQEYIPKAYELRVTVVGEEVFAARIDSQSLPENKGKIDWRQGYGEGLAFSACDISEQLKLKCTDLVHALGLNFGCIDLVVRPDGEVVFLECNPNGQWLWIELTTGLPISRSIADFLTRP